MEVKNKRILITGATSGIGKEIAKSCFEAGANLLITGRSEEKLSHIRQDLSNSVEAVIADIKLDSGRAKVVDKVKSLDGLVLAAGVIDYTPLKFVTEKKVDEVFAINFKANILLLQSLLQKKIINKGASIVLISSISSKVGVAGTLLYAASKAAVNAAAKVMAAELAPQKIRVNTICPGLVSTPMTEKSFQIMDEEAWKKAVSKYPLKIGKPSDLQGLVMFLLSDASSWMTGGNIEIDGGYSLNG